MTDSAAPSAAPTTFSERDMRVTVAGVEIACRLTIPQDDRAGAILLLPGSLYSDVDGDYPAMNMHPHTYADLAAQLGGRGFVVLRMAKIGPGTGWKTVDPAKAVQHTDFLARVDVAAAALGLLHETTSARPLIVAGHSEGAVVASLLAGASDTGSIDDVVSLSEPSLPLLGIMREQMAAMTPSGVPADMTMFDRSAARHDLPTASASSPS